jgi:carboxyl-terminal processing protease
MRDRHETYAAIQKMVALLDDPFTRFLDPVRYEQLVRGAQGSVIGVGVEVAFSQDNARMGQLLVRTLQCHMLTHESSTVQSSS